MIDYGKILEIPPYSLNRVAKSDLLNACLGTLTEHHYEHCMGYRRLLDAMGVVPRTISDYRRVPFLPVRLFKEYDLKSVKDGAVTKAITSSGTTGQQVSKIYLDRDAAALQTRTLSKIVGSYLGKARFPMVSIDHAGVTRNRAIFSARGAGVRGFSMFGRDKVHALDENMELDVRGLEAFLEKHEGQRIFLFGFTYIIWQHFHGALQQSSYRPDLSHGILIHGGGWKSMAASAVTPADFKRALEEVSGLREAYDYYGMVEQTGTIHMECESGYLHPSVFGDVIIRRHGDFSEADVGEAGIIQVLSLLPTSYPGHSLLTEDEGVVLGEDDCACGRRGKYFRVLGRLKDAEIRGCSDTYAANHA